MSGILVRRIKLRSPFTLKRMPALARFHRAASKQRSSKKAQLLVSAPLEKVFRFYYRWIPHHARGEMEFHSAEGSCAISFNGRNLAFDILYSDLFSENYEDETAVLLDTFLPKDGCLYDIGSNWGYFSLYAASRGGRLRIHAFEPVPSTYDDLVRCVEQAGLKGTVHCHMLAASESNGHTFFQLPFHSASAQVGKNGPGVKVETRTIDSLALDAPDFMKIDAEGHEAAVIRGSLATIRRAHPFIMFENKLYRDMPQETLQPLLLLKELGYNLFMPAVQRAREGATYFLHCGYQIDTGRMQRIEREDVMALVPCELERRFLFPSYLNIFACHEDRMKELREKFEELPSVLGSRAQPFEFDDRGKGPP